MVRCPTGSAAGTIWDASGSWNMTVRYADLLSDTSGRLRYRAEGAGYTFRVDTIGFEWNRGRFD